MKNAFKNHIAVKGKKYFSFRVVRIFILFRL